MKVTLWGTRGSIASAGPDTVEYGGDTSSVEVRTKNGRVIILDAGSGIRRLGNSLKDETRVDILLSHLHMDHVQGLPFFAPLLDPNVEVHIWGPISTTRTLRARLARYLSPPLFPVRVRELPKVVFHDVPPSSFEVDRVRVDADLITHPGATLGYRLTENGTTLAYLPDHEPALACLRFPNEPEWTSGYDLATKADVLIHDAQYTDDEYAERIGWGHTSVTQLIAFAELTEAKRLVTFHHDPPHTDDMLDDLHEGLRPKVNGYELIPGKTGLTIEV